MLTRAITGFFFIVVLITALFWGQIAFVAFFGFVGVWSQYEFYSIIRSEEVKPNVFMGLTAAIVLTVLSGLYFLDVVTLDKIGLFIPFISFIYISALFQKSKLPFHDISYSLFGLIYACIPFLFFIALGFIHGSYNLYIPLGFLVLLWTNDTGAYLSGKSLGKHKLFERISPNKTWEGFVGGVILAIIVAFVLAQYVGVLERWQWIVSALIISVFGTLGDLVESMLKRSLGVKDSGHILPGHGGLLDRFDGLLIAAPLVYLFLLMVI